MTDSSNKLWTVIFIFILAGNFFGYWIKGILKNNGYPVTYFSRHSRDTRNIFRLAKSTYDKNKRLKYFILGFLDIGILVALIVSVICLIINF